MSTTNKKDKNLLKIDNIGQIDIFASNLIAYLNYFILDIKSGNESVHLKNR